MTGSAAVEVLPWSPWARSWGVSLVAHVLVLTIPVMWPSSQPAAVPLPAALAVEIAELPAAPTPAPAPADVEPPAPRPQPPRPEPPLRPLPEQKPTERMAAEAVPQALPEPALPAVPMPAEAVPAQPAVAEASVAVATVRGSHGEPQPDAVQTWESQVLAEIERKKRYPASARWSRQEDIVSVRIVVNPDGSIGTARIVASQGFDALDNEVLQTLRRTGRLPPPPSDALANGVVTLTIPIQFVLKGR